MKLNRLFPFVALIIAGLLLSACSSGPAVNSYPGLTADSTKVYVSYGTNVYAVNTANGTEAWRFPAETQNGVTFYAPVAVSEDLVVVTDYAGNIYGVNPADGSQLWINTDAKGYHFIGGPVIVGDQILAPSTDNTLYVLNFQGVTEWTYDTDKPLWATPATDGTLIYQPSMDHTLYAIGLADHSLAWSQELAGALVASPLVTEDGSLYIGTLSGELYKINAADGSIVWETKADAGIWSRGLVDGGNLYIGDQAGNVYAFNAENGELVWRAEADGVILASCIKIGENLAFVTDQGSVMTFTTDGVQGWTQKIDGKLYTSPVMVDDKAFFAVTGGTNLLQTLTSEGALLWPFVPAK